MAHSAQISVLGQLALFFLVCREAEHQVGEARLDKFLSDCLSVCILYKGVIYIQNEFGILYCLSCMEG